VAKTTSGFNSDRTVRQYAHGLLLESPFVPSSTDRWAVRAKIRQNGRLGGRRGETGSRNKAATQNINSLTRFPIRSYWLRDHFLLVARSNHRTDKLLAFCYVNLLLVVTLLLRQFDSQLFNRHQRRS